MKKLLYGVFLLIIGCSTSNITRSTQNDSYHFYLNLKEIRNDQTVIELIPPAITSDEILYHLPKMVPGTYSIYDFGRFVSDLKAFDKSGRELPVEKTDDNSWKISNARTLAKITYTVDDTWDSDLPNKLFEPVGTSFEVDSLIVISTPTMFGYFEGMKNREYEINIEKPKSFYGSTALIPVKSDNNSDVFRLDSYMSLVDSPILYSKPDTAVLNIAGSEVLVSVYSPKGKVKAKSVSKNIQDLLNAAANYLGGKLPVSKYAFLIALEDGNSNSGAFGALEHSYSTLLYMPEGEEQEIAQVLRDVAAHEFYHIVTPLAIHSEEIGDFDYINPKMSKHLWLYEGQTEYTAHYVQLREGLTDINYFMNVMKEKIGNSQTRYNDTLSFTDLSLGALDKHKRQYTNVYEKGALISFCLDLKLRKLSGGKMGLKDLIAELSKKYPKTTSFKDSDLFDVITRMTYPEIRTFFADFVEGGKPLPFNEVLNYIGYEYVREYRELDFSLGGLQVKYNQEKNVFYVETDTTLNEFGKKMGYKTGDEILTLNGESMEPRQFRRTRLAWEKNVKEGDILSVEVLRNGQKVVLSTSVSKAEVPKFNKIAPIVNPTAEQLKIRAAWLGK